jgi:TonB family protein
MRTAIGLVALGILGYCVAGCCVARAQEPQSGAAAAEARKTSVPLPDKDGVYGVVDGIVPPVMVTAVPPEFPAGVTTELANPLFCVLSAVIGVDGKPERVQVVRGCNDTFNSFAIDSATRSQYQPGTLDGKPVPVLVRVRVTFQDPLFANAPRLALRSREGPETAGPSPKVYDTPPRPIHTVEAEFSDRARREGTQGNVVVSLIVDEKGMPTNVQVARGVGDGLDEQALKAVRQYRFEPATKDGKPVAVKISVEVSFKLYARQRN